MNLNKGFTLVEIMLTIVIVFILSAIAIPLYHFYLKEARENACLSEVKSYANYVFYALNDNNEETEPGLPKISTCSFITDASSWNESTTNLVIEAKSKHSSTVDIRCDLSKGANCTIIP